MDQFNLQKKAYDSIVNLIVDGTLKLGQPVSQTNLTKILNMSRTPVREALFGLERDGIFLKEGRKYSVCYISKDEIRELYEIRRELEDTSARMAAEKATKEDRKELLDLLKKIKKETFEKESDPYKLVNLNGQLHVVIARTAGNRYLEKFLNETILKLKIVRVAVINSVDRRFEELEEHSRIVDAIVSGDIGEAGRAIRNHRDSVLKYTEENVLDLLFYDDQ